jgi:hypothetical protein
MLSLPSRFPDHIFPPMPDKYIAHLIPFDFVILIILGEGYTSRTSPVRKIPQPPAIFSRLGCMSRLINVQAGTSYITDPSEK